jgi:5-amino-6-(5-phosphoribosylamino)uracil reductase
MDPIVSARPYVLLSCAMSVDGYIDDAAGQRLILSNAQDLDRVEEVRASCDAILIGAGTIRRDDPRLLVDSAARRARRTAEGLSEYPVKVTITGAGLSRDFKFFTTGGEKLVYCPASAAGQIRAELGNAATVAGLPSPLDFGDILDDLGQRGINRLMVEGGSSIHTQFLAQDLADEIQLAVAPFLVGQPDAPRFVGSGSFPQDCGRRMIVAEVRQVGDMVLTRYLTSARPLV